MRKSFLLLGCLGLLATPFVISVSANAQNPSAASAPTSGGSMPGSGSSMGGSTGASTTVNPDDAKMNADTSTGASIGTSSMSAKHHKKNGSSSDGSSSSPTGPAGVH